MKTASPWSLSFGAAYDSSCLEDEDRTPALPVGPSWRFGVGGRRTLSDRLELGIAYELAWAGNLDLNKPHGLAGRLAGSYEGAAMHFLTASLRWKL